MIARRLLIVLVALAARPVAGEALFAELAFDEALAASRRSNKPLMVDFSMPNVGGVGMSDAARWADRELQELLRSKVIAIQLRPAANAALVRRLRIRAYPTVIFFKPDGTEFERIVGFQQPADFRREASDALAGRDSLTRAREAASGAGHDDPVARMNLGRILARRGMYDEALAEYLWCLDRGLARRPEFFAVRSTQLLSEMATLGRDYPPARAALEERRDDAEAALLSEHSVLRADPRLPPETGPLEAHDLAAINRCLDDPARTVRVYDNLRAMGPAKADARRALVNEIGEQLIQARRYREIVEDGGDLLAAFEQHVRLADATLADARQRGAVGSELVARCRLNAVLGGCRCYEALLGAGRMDEAAKLAERIVQYDPAAQAYVQLIRHAIRADRPDVARQLAERGMKSLPSDQAAMVREVAALIPAGK
jgi:tetratricopeptide (TPR) repeat protein